MPDDLTPPPAKNAADELIKVNKEGGALAIIPLADRPSSDETIDRMKSTTGAALGRNIKSGDLMIAVLIMVTPQGVVYWDTQEGDVGSPPDPEKVMQMGSARLGIAHALGAVSEQMRSGLKKDRK